MSKRVARRSRAGRQKVSTTVAWENLEFLRRRARHRASTIAEVMDEVIGNARRAENRRLLAEQTAAYFASLSTEAAAEENAVGRAMSEASEGVDFENG